MDRRSFLLSAAALAAPDAGQVMTVRGPVASSALGVMLVHEHLFSNFGEPPAEPGKYDENALLAAVVPYAQSIRELGCTTIADATTAWFGRNPLLLRTISEKTGLTILTNTGYYGAGKDQYVPAHAYEETADQLAARWLKEWNDGIGSTGIRPGFFKIGVDPGALSEIDRKLVTAAARAHRRCGLTIAVHTGESSAGALEQLAILKAEGVSPTAWIWVHAYQVKDPVALKQAAEAGAWISFDGLDPDSLDHHLELVRQMKQWGRLKQVLLSHDGNSFRAGGKRAMRPYSVLFTHFLPLLKSAGFTEQEVRWMTVENPARAFTVAVRRS